MTSSNKERYYSTVGKSRRSSPGDPHSGHGFFSGQVPVSYSNVYTQPRSAPNKLSYDLDPQALYGAYPNSNTSPQFPSGFPNYEIHHERYSPHPSYPTYPSRSTPPILTNPADSRRLPPLPTSSPPPGERWSQQAFVPQSGFPANNIRSPTATYPTHNQFMQYPSANQAHPYHYHFAQDHIALNPAQNGIFDEISRLDPRSTSPFRNPGSSHVPPSQPPPHSYSPPPLSPTSPEEPTVKKKRKRADANQLKVLNETYARTAFPSTEERIALAKMLDMSARSVQIWFQNKRQSMRQTNRQTASSSSSQLPPSSSQVDSIAEELAYDTRSLHDPLYLTSPQADTSRAHASHHSAYGSYHPSSYRHRD